MLIYQIAACNILGKILKSKTKTINLKYLGQHGMKNLKYLMDGVIKKHETFTDNPPIRIYVNKIENRIIFRTNTGYYLKHVTSKTMKSIESSKSKKNRDENDETVPHLEVTEVVLVNCNIDNNDCQQDSIVLYTFAPNK